VLVERHLPGHRDEAARAGDHVFSDPG
jgi:hypothetical protein